MDVVTLMMVTYNRLELTKKTLAGLVGSTGIPYNLVVIDNGSEDGTIEFLKDKPIEDSNLQNLVIRYNKENKGIAVGRNQGLVEADKLGTNMYCTIDNDVIMPAAWLKNCVDILKANKTFGAIGINMEGAEYPAVTLNGFTFQHKPQGNLGTACMVFPKAVHQMLGFFNMEFGRPYSCEDSDLGFRLTRCLNMKIGYAANGTHLGEDGGPNPSDYRKFKTELHEKTAPVFFKVCREYLNKTKPVYIPFKDES